MGLLHTVQERKKFEFVEAILSFTQAWVSYYRRGNEVATEQAEYMTDLQARVQKTRDNFSATLDQYEGLKDKMVSSPGDPGTLNRMYTRCQTCYNTGGCVAILEVSLLQFIRPLH